MLMAEVGVVAVLAAAGAPQICARAERAEASWERVGEAAVAPEMAVANPVGMLAPEVALAIVRAAKRES